MTGAPALTLRILADDLTGALDSAAAFEGDVHGEVPVYFDAPACEAAPTPVSAVATATRDVPPETLPAALAGALPWLRAADIAFKKVDSLWRGNTFAEVVHLARAGGFTRIVFAPAYPQQGRLTRNGRLQAPGVAASPDAREALAAAGVPVDCPDVASDAELLALARQALTPEARGWLWCGSAGLALALAQVLQRAPQGAPALAGVGAQPLLMLSASHHSVVRRQWQRLLAAPAAQGSDVLARTGDPAQVTAALAALAGPYRQALIDLSPREVLTPAQAAELLARQMGQLDPAGLRPGVLVVVGGDTLRALCRATGAHGLAARAAARPGWGQARWLGGAWDGVPCHSRSGAFGNDDDLAEIVAALGA